MIDKINNLAQIYGMMIMLFVFSMSLVFGSMYLWGANDPAAFLDAYSPRALLQACFVGAIPLTAIWYCLPHNAR